MNASGDLAGVRVMSVLGRISLCYLFGTLIIYFWKISGSVAISFFLLLSYWLLCLWLGKPGDPYSLTGYFGTAIDKAVFGPAHLYHGEGVAFDPEGLASTLAAITQVVFGYLTGWLIQQKGKSQNLLRLLLLVAVISLALGYAWSEVFPINKKIWTSSFVLVSTGYAILCLVVLIYIIEIRHWKGWGSRFFDVFGKNPLFIFVLSGFVPRVLGLIRIAPTGSSGSGYPDLSPMSWFFDQVCRPLTAGNVKNASLLYSFVLVLIYWLIGYALDKRKIYIRV